MSDSERLKRLEKLRDAVLILCDADRWTIERADAWLRLTGKVESRYIDLYELAREVDGEQA